MTLKTPLILFCAFCAFCGSAFAQVTAEIREIKVEYATAAERTSLVLTKGQLVADDADPSLLYIGDGITPGGLLVTPPTGEWSHSATKDIYLNGHRLHLGAGYSLITLGAYAAISGQGELQTDVGTSSWAINATPMIRVAAEGLLVNIESLAWDDASQQFVMILNVGSNQNLPTIQGATDLVLGDWAAITQGVTIGASAAGKRTITIDYAADWDILFFRAVLDSTGFAKVELLADTEVTGNLTVTGTVTGDGSGLTNVGADLPATATQAEAEAGTETELRSWTPERIAQAILALSPPQPRVVDYALGFFPQPVANDLDWLLIARPISIDAADEGVAYARTVATAETVFTLTKNGTSIGTVTFGASANVGTVAITATTTFASGDRLELLAGATPNATLADIQVIIKGTLL